MRETPAAKTPDRRVPPAEATLQVIVGRWKTLILWHLFQGSAQGGIFSDGTGREPQTGGCGHVQGGRNAHAELIKLPRMKGKIW
jgi:hypothetical protein